MLGRISMGIQTPIIREGDDLKSIVINSILNSVILQDGDIIGITESVVARAAGLYVTVDDVADSVISLFGNDCNIIVDSPIYSRNRFSMILKGIARAAKNIVFYMPNKDEVGNPSGVNRFTGVHIQDYYRHICIAENCNCSFIDNFFTIMDNFSDYAVIHCNLHKPKVPMKVRECSLYDLCADKNPDFGLLGSNKASEEKLKLFPTKELAQKLVEDIQSEIKERFHVHVECLVYGDGCFKDPVGGIWEFADPVTCPGYTKGLEGTPNEIKLKAFADDKYANLSGLDLERAIKEEISMKDNNLVGHMASQGTTPRRKIDLLASLMDLTSGSGDMGTPVVLVRNYERNYGSC